MRKGRIVCVALSECFFMFAVAFDGSVYRKCGKSAHSRVVTYQISLIFSLTFYSFPYPLSFKSSPQ